jgi:hypothetical protein
VEASGLPVPVSAQTRVSVPGPVCPVPVKGEGGVEVRDALTPGTSGQIRMVPAPEAKIEAPPHGHFFRDGGLPLSTPALTDGRGGGQRGQEGARNGDAGTPTMPHQVPDQSIHDLLAGAKLGSHRRI